MKNNPVKHCLKCGRGYVYEHNFCRKIHRLHKIIRKSDGEDRLYCTCGYKTSQKSKFEKHLIIKGNERLG